MHLPDSTYAPTNTDMMSGLWPSVKYVYHRFCKAQAVNFNTSKRALKIVALFAVSLAQPVFVILKTEFCIQLS